MAGNFEIDVDGLPRTKLGIRAVAGRKDRIKHLLSKAAEAGANAMRMNIPHTPPTKTTGGMFRAIAHREASYHPGGPGGGGTWRAVFGPEYTPETVDATGRSYISNVFEGTGLYGPRADYIKSKPGNVMVIENYKPRDLDFSKKNPLQNSPRSGPIFTHKTRGQPAQKDWFFAGIAAADLVISSNLHRVFDPFDDLGGI